MFIDAASFVLYRIDIVHIYALYAYARMDYFYDFESTLDINFAQPRKWDKVWGLYFQCLDCLYI